MMTSAPSQARACVHVVPASNWVRSRIRTSLSACSMTRLRICLGSRSLPLAVWYGLAGGSVNWNGL